MNDILTEITSLRSEVHELKGMLEQLLNPASALSIAEKARMIREAHESGDRKKIIEMTRKVNGRKPHAKKRVQKN